MASELFTNHHSSEVIGRDSGALSRLIPELIGDGTRAAALRVVRVGLAFAGQRPDRTSPRTSAATLTVLRACRVVLSNPHSVRPALETAASAAAQLCALFPRGCDIPSSAAQIVLLRNDLADLCADKKLTPLPPIASCPGR